MMPKVTRLDPQQMQDILRAILPFMHLLFEWIFCMMAVSSAVIFEQTGSYA
jgi:hypothetical protein